MLTIRESQLHGIVLNQRKMLIRDIQEHLAKYRPDIGAIYPKPYLLWVINDSIEIASQFRIDDIFSIRLFVRLRWEIAPGFYKQPEIARVLSQERRTAEDRFKELATERFAESWEAAQQFNDPDEWRARFWRSDE